MKVIFQFLKFDKLLKPKKSTYILVEVAYNKNSFCIDSFYQEKLLWFLEKNMLSITMHSIILMYIHEIAEMSSNWNL